MSSNNRDIKPQNIFIKGNSCILGDFGLLKVLDGNVELDREIFKESTGVGMPFYYRTPDLVDYAKQKGPITTQSDIFQLGLVITELFTGRNPSKRLQSGDDIYNPVQLDSFWIPEEEEIGKRIYGQLLTMLEFDPEKRQTASNLLFYWQNLFTDVIAKITQEGGKIF